MNSRPSGDWTSSVRKTSPQAQWKKPGVAPSNRPCVPLPLPGAPKSSMALYFACDLPTTDVSQSGPEVAESVGMVRRKHAGYGAVCRRASVFRCFRGGFSLSGNTLPPR